MALAHTVVLRAVTVEDVCNFLMVREYLQLEKPFQKVHTNYIIIAGLLNEKVSDPSRDIKAKRLGIYQISSSETSFNFSPDKLYEID